MANKLTFAIAIKLMSDEFQKSANAVKNSLRSIQMQVVTFATALGVGGLGLSGLITRFKDVARETSRVTTALKNVSDGTKGFTDNLHFINGLAKKYGLEVNALISNFASFTASANQANMPMKDQVKIFESLSKASTAFALSSEQTDGVFLALTQMMGKGKISMEELRNQMGEKLPIAMSAMAKALGVSVSEMDKMVSSGKVMSADVLPKFADALDGMIPEIDTDNLEASISRLSNAFRDVVDSSGFQEKYKSIIDGLTTLVQVAGENIKTIVQGVISVVLGLVALGASKTLKTLWATTDQVTANQKRLTAIYESEGTKVLELERKIQAKRIQYIEASGVAQKKAYRELVALQKDRLSAVASQGKAQLAMETAMAEKGPGLWTRAFGMIKLSVAKLKLALKSLWSSFAPMIIITGLTMIAQKVYELATATTTAEKAMNDFNAESLKESKNLNAVFDAYKKANEGTSEKDRLLGVIKSKYGEYIKDLIDEKGHITDIDKAQRRANESLRQSIALKVKNVALGEVTEAEVKNQAKAMGKIRDRLAKNKNIGDEKANSMIAHIGEMLSNDKKTVKVKKVKDGKLQEVEEQVDIPYSEIQKNITDYLKKETGDYRAFEKYTAGFGSNDLFNLIDSAEKLREETTRVENQFKGIIKDFKEPAPIESALDTTQTTTTATNTGKSSDNTAEKRLEALRKLDEEDRQRQIDKQKFDLDIEQKTLNNNKDGYEKERKQNELNHKKDLLSIQEFENEKLKAQREYAKTKYESVKGTDKGFETYYKGLTSADLSNILPEGLRSEDIQKQVTSLTSVARSSLSKANQETDKAEQERIKALLASYQDYTAKRLAIDEKYKKDTEELNEALSANPSNQSIKSAIVQLQKDWKEALSSVDTDELKDSIDWQYVFGDLDRVSTKAIENLKNKLEQYLKVNSKNLSAVDIKALEDALERLRTKYAELKPSKAFTEGFNEYKTATETVKRLKEELESLRAGGQQVVGIEYDKATGKMTPILKTTAQAEKDLTDAQNARANSLVLLGKSVESYAKKMNQILGIANEMVSTLEDFGIDVSDNVKDALDGLGQFASGVSQFGADLATKNYFGAVQSGIKAVGGLAKTFSSLFGGGGKSEYQKLKEKYDALNKVWDELISKKKEYISVSYGKEIKEVGDEAKAIVNKQVEANRTLGKAFMNTQKNKRGSSWGVRQRSRMDSSDWADIKTWKDKYNISDDLYAGVTNKRMTGLFDLTGQQLEDLKSTAPAFWAKLNTETQEYLDNIISGAEQLEEIDLAINEQLTKMSLDSFTNGYVDKLKDLKSTNKDLADDFKENMRNAILESLVNQKYGDAIKKLHEDWASAMDSSDGTPSKDAYDQLAKESDALNSAMIAERDRLAKLYGWDVSSSQSSTVGYSVSMDQDTGGAILGRVTGVHETLISLNSTASKIGEILSGISMASASSYTSSATLYITELQKQTEILNDSFQIHKKSFFKIDEINTKMDKLDSIDNRLSNVEKNTKNL